MRKTPRLRRRKKTHSPHTVIATITQTRKWTGSLLSHQIRNGSLGSLPRFNGSRRGHQHL